MQRLKIPPARSLLAPTCPYRRDCWVGLHSHKPVSKTPSTTCSWAWPCALCAGSQGRLRACQVQSKQQRPARPPPAAGNCPATSSCLSHSSRSAPCRMESSGYSSTITLISRQGREQESTRMASAQRLGNHGGEEHPNLERPHQTP